MFCEIGEKFIDFISIMRVCVYSHTGKHTRTHLLTFLFSEIGAPGEKQMGFKPLCKFQFWKRKLNFQEQSFTDLNLATWHMCEMVEVVYAQSLAVFGTAVLIYAPCDCNVASDIMDYRVI